MRTVKIMAQGIQNLTDARFFAAWNVDWLVFSLDPAASDYLAAERVAAIRAWVEGPQIVGMAGIQSGAEIADLVTTLHLDALIAGMAVSLESVQEWSRLLPVYKEMVVEPTADVHYIQSLLRPFSPFVQGFILDFNRNGLTWESVQKGMPLSIADIREIAEQEYILLSVHAPADQYKAIAEETGCRGFCLQGGEEEKTGFKSFDYLDEVLEQLEVPLHGAHQ